MSLLDDLVELEHRGWRSLCDGSGAEPPSTPVAASASVSHPGAGLRARLSLLT
jgi:hypothetical protein